MNKILSFALIYFVLLSIPPVVYADKNKSNKNETASPIVSPQIIIDGELNEAIWQQALVFDGFKVTKPLSLEKPPNKTQVLVTSDDKGLYIGFVNYQLKNESVSSNSLKDADINTDFNQVIIDFDAQGVRAFGFKVSRTGAMQDSVWLDENRESTDWDADWLSAVEVDDDIWQSEIFIPWSVAIMTQGEADKRKLKIFLSRWHQGKNQSFAFPAISPEQQTFLSKFEPLELAFSASSSLDFFPYIAYNRNLELSNTEQRAGVDIFWKPTTSQQLNLTVNPDFGQVESDELVVNFSAIETFTSEKRPFFRENHDLFDLQGPESLRLVHTPRIGAAQAESASTDIMAAARYSMIGDYFDFGLLSALEDDTSYLQGNNYFAARLLYKQQSFQLGLLHSVTDKPSLNRHANVSTFNYQFDPMDEIRVSGQVIQTRVETDDVNLSLSEIKQDVGWWLTTQWQPNDELSHELTLINYGHLMDVSDFGFVARVNRQQWEYEGAYQWADLDYGFLGSQVRDIEWFWQLQDKNNKQQHQLPMAIETGLEITFSSTRSVELAFERREKGIDDLITRGNNPVYFPTSQKVSLAYLSAKNNWYTYEVGLAKGHEYLAGNLSEFEFIPNFQLSENTDLSIEIEWIKNDSWLIWDELNQLEEFKRDELSIAFNFNAVVAEKHEFRLKIESVALEAIALNEYQANQTGELNLTSEKPDSFSLSEFATQFRYRYAMSGLSELFIVYSRGGEYEREILGIGRYSLINRAINNDESENLMLKLKMHF